MVTLVEDDVREVLGAEALEEATCALDRREHVISADRVIAPAHHLAKRVVEQHVAERVPRLVQQLEAMREEQEPWRETAHLTRVVERGDDGLAGAVAATMRFRRWPSTTRSARSRSRIASWNGYGLSANNVSVGASPWRASARAAVRRARCVESSGS